MRLKQIVEVRRRQVGWQMVLGGTLLALLLAVLGGVSAHSRQASVSVRVSVFAAGLNTARGLACGLDGALSVAEGGRIVPNGTSTVGLCRQVLFPVGPDAGSQTSGSSQISSSGEHTTVADDLPSCQTSSLMGNLVSGVAWSLDGTRIASASTKVQVWRARRLADFSNVGRLVGTIVGIVGGVCLHLPA
jgi:hypothetical protein